MKRRWQILVSIIMYVIILAIALDFDIIKLFAPKIALLVVFGTLILTLPYYEKGMGVRELGYVFGQKSIEAGFIQTVLMLFARLQGEKGYAGLLYDIAMCFRPMLYGFVFWVFLSERRERAEGMDFDGGKQVRRRGNGEKCGEDVQFGNGADLKSFGLTRREEEIVGLILEGKSNKEIGEELFISETTVKKHVSNIFEKVGVGRREELFAKVKK